MTSEKEGDGRETLKGLLLLQPQPQYWWSHEWAWGVVKCLHASFFLLNSLPVGHSQIFLLPNAIESHAHPPWWRYTPSTVIKFQTPSRVLVLPHFPCFTLADAIISFPFPLFISLFYFFGSLKNKDGSSLPHCIIVIIGVVYDDGYSWVPVLQKPLKHCHGHLWTNLISLTSPTSLVCEKKLNFFIKIFSGGGSLLQGGKVKKKNGCEFVHREGREPLLLGLAIIVLVWTDLFISFTHLRHLLRILYICSLPHNLLPPYASLLPLTASLLFVDWPDLLFGHSPSLNIG